VLATEAIMRFVLRHAACVGICAHLFVLGFCREPRFCGECVAQQHLYPLCGRRLALPAQHTSSSVLLPRTTYLCTMLRWRRTNRKRSHARYYMFSAESATHAGPCVHACRQAQRAWVSASGHSAQLALTLPIRLSSCRSSDSPSSLACRTLVTNQGTLRSMGCLRRDSECMCLLRRNEQESRVQTHFHHMHAYNSL
jgi:hypothetical protein